MTYAHGVKMALSLAGVLIVLCSVAESHDQSVDERMTTKRLKMVDEQILKRGISDPRVLEALRTIPRHDFVSADGLEQAYDDHPLYIGYGQTISQPYIVALMSESARLQPTDRVLEIGTGSGYQAAVLSILAEEVYTIEIVEELGQSAEVRLKELGYDNVHVRIGDGYKGWPEKAPFDVILVTAAPEEVPKELLAQLAEGGRMVVPVGETHQQLLLLEKRDGKVERSTITSVRFVPMVHGDDKEEAVKEE